jgi:DNA-nicking Smr family endonuclease
MQDVKPLKRKHNKISVKRRVDESKVKQPAMDETISLIQYDPNGPIIPPVTSDAHLSFKHPSISHKILRNLGKGQYNVDAILDLHGYTVSHAQSALDRFLQECIREQNRVVLIIHGKSRSSDTPILKNKLNEWLRQIRAVLAFCSAQPIHGSRGAVYVLLKRHSEEDLLE